MEIELIGNDKYVQYWEVKSDYPFDYMATLWDSQSDLTDDGQYDPVFFARMDTYLVSEPITGLRAEEGLDLQEKLQEDKEFLLAVANSYEKGMEEVQKRAEYLRSSEARMGGAPRWLTRQLKVVMWFRENMPHMPG